MHIIYTVTATTQGYLKNTAVDSEKNCWNTFFFTIFLVGFFPYNIYIVLLEKVGYNSTITVSPTT
jgi:hypothetical protein